MKDLHIGTEPETAEPVSPNMSAMSVIGIAAIQDIILSAGSLADLLRRPNCRWFCRVSPGWGLVPPQSRPLRCALRAAAPAEHNFLRRSAARNRFDFPARSAW